MMRTDGFSLPEILLALLVMSGGLVSLMGGLRGAEALEHRAAFEERAAAYAEREIELLKNDLLAGLRPDGPARTRGRFRLPGGWKTSLAWTPQPGEPSIRLACTVESGDNRLAVESFLYLSEGGRAAQ